MYICIFKCTLFLKLYFISLPTKNVIFNVFPYNFKILLILTLIIFKNKKISLNNT